MATRKTTLKKRIRKKFGTQIFNYNDVCHICGKFTKVDINAECKGCEKSMRKFRGIK